jgi:hypothetical protein
VVSDDRARAAAADVRAEVSERRAEVAAARPGWYWWAVMAVTAVAGPSIAIGISRHNQRQSEQVWCDVITVMDDAYRDPAAPPTSEVGRKIAAGIARVRAAYHC